MIEFTLIIAEVAAIEVIGAPAMCSVNRSLVQGNEIALYWAPSAASTSKAPC